MPSSAAARPAGAVAEVFVVALGGGRLLAGLLYGVDASDPRTLADSFGLVVAVSASAQLLPVVEGGPGRSGVNAQG